MSCSHSTWLSKPLCCRYVFAEFKTLRLPIRDGKVVRDMPWQWALGLFKLNQYEVLGAWPTQLASEAVAHDLHQRGIVQIDSISADCTTDCSLQFPDAGIGSSTSAPSKASSPAAMPISGPRRQVAIQSAADTAKCLQASLTRAIARRAPFMDEAAAAAFLAQALEEADRRLYEVPKTRLRTTPCGAASAISLPFFAGCSA